MSPAPIIPKPSEQPGVGRPALEAPVTDPIITVSAGRFLKSLATKVEKLRKRRGDV